MRSAIERALQQRWYGQAASGWQQALSRLVAACLPTHRPQARPPVPVVVIGSVVAGGSGKTPTVIAVVQALQMAGHRMAVVSRGYGRRGRGLLRVQADTDPRLAGDEPVLIAAATGAEVWVGADRAAALQAAVRAGAEVVVSDDGLQHSRMPRSFECCVLDAQRGVGNGCVLPFGPLRQPLSRLAEVDQLLWRVSAADDGVPSLGSLCAGQGPATHRVTLHIDSLHRLDERSAGSTHALTGQAVTVLCAVANPAQVEDTVRALGMRVQSRRWLADHHAYRPKDLEGLPTPIVVTAKDAVKLQRMNLPADLREHIWVLTVAMALPKAMMEALLSHVRQFDLESPARVR